MKNKLFFTMLISFLLIQSIVAQDDGMPPEPEQPGPPSLPIDGYLPYLVLAGVVYTSWKLVYRKKTCKNSKV